MTRSGTRCRWFLACDGLPFPYWSQENRERPVCPQVSPGQAGNIISNSVTDEAFALARYIGNGKLDSTFGNGGRVTTSFGNADAFITSIVLQSDGEIVVAGGNGGTKLEVARYLGQ
jgi:hypothetical protein